jgi:lipopolysaccharide export system permease protein
VIRRLIKPLDRYILSAFFRVFIATALGFPLLVVIIDLTDHLGEYLGRNIAPAKVALSYLYFMPESLFLVLPASVLFATVFTVGSLGRHSEITAAKASGISFHRLILPLFWGSVFATGLGLVVGEVVPIARAERNDILGKRDLAATASRVSFAHAAEDGRIYEIGQLDVGRRAMMQLEIQRRGTGPNYPTVITTANEAVWRYTPEFRGWVLRDGVVHILPNDTTVFSVQFVTLSDRKMNEQPEDLLQDPKAPEEMPRRDVLRHIAAMERSGLDVNQVRVDLMLRIAVPVTCIIIFLFGAPLSATDHRGGAAYGIAVALGTTVTFMLLVQLTRAFGSKGFVTPELAAWIPSMVFGLAGLALLVRVRT